MDIEHWSAERISMIEKYSRRADALYRTNRIVSPEKNAQKFNKELDTATTPREGARRREDLNIF